MNHTDPTAAAIRAAAFRDAEEICDEAGAVYTSKALSGEADGAYSLMERFRRKAEEAEQASAVVSPPTDRAELRKAAAEALFEHWDVHANDADLADDFDCCADAVLAVLPEPTDRAAVLLEAADRMSRKAAKLTEGLDDLAIFVGKARAAEAEILNREADELRRLAAEAQQPDCDHDSQVIDHEGAQYWVCLKCGTNLGRVEAEQQPAAADGEETRPLRNSEELCPGFPDRCPNLRTVEPDPPVHLGGIRCGCADA